MTRGLTTPTADAFDFGPIVRHRMARTIRAGALRFLAMPQRLEAISTGLSVAPPRRALAVLDHLEEQFWCVQRRWIGFGGEVPLINIKAAKLAMRWNRRFRVKMEAGCHG